MKTYDYDTHIVTKTGVEVEVTVSYSLNELDGCKILSVLSERDNVNVYNDLSRSQLEELREECYENWAENYEEDEAEEEDSSESPDDVDDNQAPHTD